MMSYLYDETKKKEGDDEATKAEEETPALLRRHSTAQEALDGCLSSLGKKSLFCPILLILLTGL
jgi:hypothetical protein